jgi:2-keto-4-pentenoate hydratase/2-oxohepta-3-ene-1,7-dioic acid hydratase in catechol pathway
MRLAALRPAGVAHTSAMLNGVAQLVSYLSHVCTLEPGDLIATGNPDHPDF